VTRKYLTTYFAEFLDSCLRISKIVLTRKSYDTLLTAIGQQYCSLWLIPEYVTVLNLQCSQDSVATHAGGGGRLRFLGICWWENVKE